MANQKKLKSCCSYLLILLFFLITLQSCGIYKKVNTREVSTNADERARKAISEGKGVNIRGLMGGEKNNFEFSSSNPLWRASLEAIDFMPLTTVDYSGGIIITDWYNNSTNSNEAIKITLRFLSNEIQSNSIKVIVHSKNCGPTVNCTINEIDSNIKFELQQSILSKAASLEKERKNSKK